MSLEPALLAAIAAVPDDDLPRLVYADWLDENGRPLRAEFIRLQIEIARKETLPRAAVNVFSHLWKRQQEILDDHREELLGPLVGVVSYHDVEFRRGFLDDIFMPAEMYSTYGGSVAALVPLPTRVKVTQAGGHAERFFRRETPGLDAITDLSVPTDREHMPDPAEFVFHIRNCSRWPRLQTLDLEFCRLGDMLTDRLFFHPVFPVPALEELDLSFNDLTDAGVIALLNTGVPQRLKRLVLGGNPIGDQAAIELADRLGRSTVLESLNLRMTNIGRPGQVALTRTFGGRVDLF